MIIKDYYCETCKRVIHPFELESSMVKQTKAWKHKACKQHTIIRKDKPIESANSTKPIVKAKAKEVIETIDDLFE